MVLNFFFLYYIRKRFAIVTAKYFINIQKTAKTPCGYTSDIGKKKTINKAQHFPSEVRRCAVANHWHLI